MKSVQYADTINMQLHAIELSASRAKAERRGQSGFALHPPTVCPRNNSGPLTLVRIIAQHKGRQRSEGGSRASPSTPRAWPRPLWACELCMPKEKKTAACKGQAQGTVEPRGDSTHDLRVGGRAWACCSETEHALLTYERLQERALFGLGQD